MLNSGCRAAGLKIGISDYQGSRSGGGKYIMWGRTRLWDVMQPNSIKIFNLNIVSRS